MYDNSVDDFEEMDEVIVDSWNVVKTLEAPVNFGNLYMQKLTAYFQVNRLRAVLCLLVAIKGI